MLGMRKSTLRACVLEIWNSRNYRNACSLLLGTAKKACGREGKMSPVDSELCLLRGSPARGPGSGTAPRPWPGGWGEAGARWRCVCVGGGRRFDADSVMKRIALQGSGLPCQGSSGRPKPPWALCGPVRVSRMPPTTWRRVRAVPALAGPRGGRRPCRRKHMERTLSEPIQPKANPPLALRRLRIGPISVGAPFQSFEAIGCA